MPRLADFNYKGVTAKVIKFNEKYKDGTYTYKYLIGKREVKQEIFAKNRTEADEKLKDEIKHWGIASFK